MEKFLVSQRDSAIRGANCKCLRLVAPPSRPVTKRSSPALPPPRQPRMPSGFSRAEDEAKVDRAACLRRGRAVSLRHHLWKCQHGERDGIEERMHGHGDENRTAPFVGKRETTSQDKQRREGGKMCMRGGEQHRVPYDSDKTTEIAFEHAVKKKAEKKFLDYRRDCHGENNDHDALHDGG